jgi:hypothetical protein
VTLVALNVALTDCTDGAFLCAAATPAPMSAAAASKTNTEMRFLDIAPSSLTGIRGRGE